MNEPMRFRKFLCWLLGCRPIVVRTHYGMYAYHQKYESGLETWCPRCDRPGGYNL